MSPEVSTIGGDQSVEELRRELADAHRREAATAEVLKVISRSTFDLQGVLDALVESASRLCGAADVSISRLEGDRLLRAVHFGPIRNPVGYVTPAVRSTVSGLCVLERRPVHVADLQDEKETYPEPFSEKQIELVTTFADQAVIAIENTRLFEAEQTRTKELQESLEYQTATSEVLNAISRSPTDAQPVFDMIAASALRLCDAGYGQVALYDGELLHMTAFHNVNVEGVEALRRRFPAVADRGSAMGRAIHTRAVVQIPDILDDPAYAFKGELQTMGFRSLLVAPMLAKSGPIGAIAVGRSTPGAFSDRKIELLKTFADQAVIAIENTRLFEEVQARTGELSDALERQTATSEVLNVISRSPNQLQPVLDSIVATAADLCQADFAMIHRLEHGKFRLVAANKVESNYITWLAQNPPTAGPGSVSGRAVAECATIHIPDVLADPEYSRTRAESLKRGNQRTTLGVPLVREGVPIGVIALHRTEVRPFTDKQIELVTTFADQAVIAIENTRLFEAEQASKRELQESLEYQTATSDVLNIIGRSPTDARPAFDVIAKSAARLCAAQFCHVFRFDGHLLHFSASQGLAPEAIALIRQGYPMLPARASISGRAILSGAVEVIPDIDSDAAYGRADTARAIGYRSIVAVPMLRDTQPVGAIVVGRAEPGLFPLRQVELLRTFADQAVIAIENTRLFEAEQASKRELQESLEYQTATSDVLGVISRSKFDLQPVLDSIVATAARLCIADMATIRRREGDLYIQLAGCGLSPDYTEFSRRNSWHHAGRGSLVARVLERGKAVQIDDVLADPDYALGEAQRLGGFRTILGVPLLREGDQIGIVVLMREKVQPFTKKQIELVEAFADQAVIAIENVRLFEEVQARTHELAKTVEDLEIASQHKSQFVANMSHELRTPLAAILGYAELMQEGFYEPQGKKSLDALTRIRSNGKHLLGLINTVLDIAKIESGQFSLNLGEYAIETVVETVRAATESLAETKKLSLWANVAKKLPVGLGDEQRLTQVLLNLVGNAIKFTDTGEVRITATAINGNFTVAVADTGPGIPREELNRVFEQFHQIDNSNTKAKGGTGLGLAIAKQIVEMHGGRIWVESTLGQGATFHMDLPIRTEARKAAE